MELHNLDKSKSYYRRWTTSDIIVTIIAVLLVGTLYGTFLALILFFVYPLFLSKFLVSDIDNKDEKIWVRKNDWKEYRLSHGIGYFTQYRPNRVVTSEQSHAPQGNADELKKFKKLLDEGTITQEEFNAKKKQILGI